MEKRKSESRELVKECIFTALMILMEENRYEDIKITGITEKAGVSRMAYYRNYSSKDEILTMHFDELFKKCLEELTVEKEPDYRGVIFRFFGFFADNRRLVHNLIKANLLNLMADRFQVFAHYVYFTYLNAESSSEKEHQQARYGAHFLAGGLYFITLEWIKSGMEESQEEVTELFFELLQSTEKEGE